MIQNLFSDKWPRQSWLTLFIFWSMISILWASPPDFNLSSLTDQQVNLRKLQHYPALIVIVPQEESLELSIRLYQKLSHQLDTQTYLLVSPNLPFYRPQYALLSTLEKTIDDELKAGVLLDWNQDVAKHLYADDSDLPMVLLLEEDGSILGRFRFEFVTNAFEFIAYTFPTLLSFHPAEFWANSSTDIPFSIQGMQ